MHIRRGLDRAAALAGDTPLPGYTSVDRHRDFLLTFRETPVGRRVLSQLLVRCRVMERSFVPGDTHETSRREGMRDIGLWLIDVLDADPADGRTASRPEACEEPV